MKLFFWIPGVAIGLAAILFGLAGVVVILSDQSEKALNAAQTLSLYGCICLLGALPLVAVIGVYVIGKQIADDLRN
jgi:hypothetical protein